MKTISRRELNQRSGRILDEVLATGEPVEVVTRGVGSVVISRRPESQYEEWVRLGLVRPSTARLDRAPRTSSPRSVDEMRRDIDSDH